MPSVGNLKPVEDRIDAVLCAFIAANWWWWTTRRNKLYGNEESGYIVVPDSPDGSRRELLLPQRECGI